MNFSIPKNYYCDEETIFRKSNMELQPGLTVLAGCNGSGKTTMINHLKSILEEKGIPYKEYNNLAHGGSNAVGKYLFEGKNEIAATLVISSEGEQIYQNFGLMLREIGRYAKKCTEDGMPMWLFLDAADSGLSIDNIIEFKDIFNLILSDNEDKEVYIIVSANEYEMCRSENCFDVTNGRYIRFRNYEDYRSFILKSASYKEKRMKGE